MTTPVPPSRAALVSIHDVMPETLDRVLEVFDLLGTLAVKPVTLLVVPGRSWHPHHIDQILQMVHEGAQIAAHGWYHTAGRIRGPKHYLHSLLISRHTAEHLALSPPQITELLHRCATWFTQSPLPRPSLYVPPAWAMGMALRCLPPTPFQYYETLCGVYDRRQRQFRPLPLAGFEADRWLRGWSLRLWNHLNHRLSRHQGMLRIAIHPYDLHYTLRPDLIRLLKNPWQFYDYSAGLNRLSHRPGFSIFDNYGKH